VKIVGIKSHPTVTGTTAMVAGPKVGVSNKLEARTMRGILFD